MDDLETHIIRDHEADLIECNLCDTLFVTPDGFGNHFANHKQKCEVCGKVCENADALKRHLEKVYNHCGAYGNHKCVLCGEQYFSVWHFKQHV